jgi:hypothetical protein
MTMTPAAASADGDPGGRADQGIEPMTGPAAPDGSAVQQPLSLTKSANLQPLVEGDGAAETSLEAQVDAPVVSRGRRVIAAAANAREQTIKRLVGVLVPLIKAAGYPLLLVVLLAGVPAVAVILLALLRPGPDDPFWLILGAVGLLVAGWLAMRRRQLLAVAKDPDALAQALSSVVTGKDMWEQLTENVSAGNVGAAVLRQGRRRARPLRILGGLWRGVQLTGVLTQITEREELQPLLPGRLRGLWFLGIACLIASVVLWLAVLVAGLIYLLGG